MLENKIEQRDDWLFLILGHCESRPSCFQLSSLLQDTELCPNSGNAPVKRVYSEKK